jgi:hypothetical protein
MTHHRRRKITGIAARGSLTGRRTNTTSSAAF